MAVIRIIRKQVLDAPREDVYLTFSAGVKVKHIRGLSFLCVTLDKQIFKALAIDWF
jgi:hypothetical protein